MIHAFGGPEVLQVEDVPEPDTPDGFLKVSVDAAGVNFADTHQSENSYLVGDQQLPLLPGSEVVGHVVEDRSVRPRPTAWSAAGSPPSSAAAGTPSRRSSIPSAPSRCPTP